jgi:site-specific DNA-methyltransferase (adenine-specific)
MKQYPDNYFDLACVDPPYGLDLANMNKGAGKSKKASKIINRIWIPKNWDKQTPTKEYFNELFRVSKYQIIWGGNYFELPPCKNYIIWDKEIPNGLSFADCEMAWTSFDRAPRIFRYSAYLDKVNKFHPTQKPKALYKFCYEFAKIENGAKILDTHLGSGNSRIVAKRMNFNFVGFEIDKEYFDAANENYEKEINGIIKLDNQKIVTQLSLF